MTLEKKIVFREKNGRGLCPPLSGPDAPLPEAVCEALIDKLYLEPSKLETRDPVALRELHILSSVGFC